MGERAPVHNLIRGQVLEDLTRLFLAVKGELLPEALARLEATVKRPFYYLMPSGKFLYNSEDS